MGAEFLEIEFEEQAGSGDGYAKEMSDLFNLKLLSYMQSKQKMSISLLQQH